MTLLPEIRLAWRRLRRHGGVSSIAALMIAGGVAASATGIHVFDRLLFRPPDGVRDPDGIHAVVVAEPTRSADIRRRPFLSWSEVSGLDRALPSLAYTSPDSTTITCDSCLTGISVRVSSVTSRYFRVLGVGAEFGRLQNGDQSEVSPSVVLSYSLWKRLKGDRPLEPGTDIVLGLSHYTLVGVAQRGFEGIDRTPTDAWVTLGAPGQFSDLRARSVGYQFRVVVRETPAVATRVLNEFIGGTVEAGSTIRRGPTPELRSIKEIRWADAGEQGKLAAMLAIVCVGILLIVCVDTSALLLARAIQSQRDMVLQLMLGSSRGVLVRQFALEGAAVIVAGCILGLVLAGLANSAAARLLLGAGAPTPPVFDARTLAIDAGVMLLCALIGVAMPSALIARAVGLAQSNHRAGLRIEHTGTLRRILAVQMAISFAVIAIGGQFLLSLQRTLTTGIGLDLDRIAFAQLRPLRGSGDASTSLAAAMVVSARLSQSPSVERVAVASSFPLRSSTIIAVKLPVDSAAYRSLRGPFVTEVSPEYFTTMGLRLAAGRLFGRDENEGPVAVINTVLARAIWGRHPRLGQCLEIGAAPVRCYAVVGVVNNTAGMGIADSTSMQVFLPLAQSSRLTQRPYVIVRGGKVGNMLPDFQAALRLVDTTAFRFRVTTMHSVVEPEVRPLRLASRGFLITGGLALVLAASGIYSVWLFAVRARSREFAVRVAVGATPKTVAVQVAREALGVVAFGLIGGALGMILLEPIVQHSLMYSSYRSPAPYVGAAAVLIFSAILSIAQPALQAARVDVARTLTD